MERVIVKGILALAEMQRRPSAAELEALTEAYRRDPGSPAFVSLGEALIALGRPRDAVEIGARGLRANPQNFHGRLMVAQAFIAMHQWKEAQAELLKVVKSDRNNGPAFRALGEVLLRRSDYERAVPVLQHAHNLAPADPSILDLLRRARSGQPPEPPPPQPTPMAPAALAGGVAPNEFEDVPTKVAGEDYNAQVAEMVADAQSGSPNAAALARMQLDQLERRGQQPAPPMERPVRRSDGRGQDAIEARPVQMHPPPPKESPLAPMRGNVPMAGPHQPTMMPPNAAGPHQPTVMPQGAAGPHQPTMMPETARAAAQRVPAALPSARTMAPTADRSRPSRVSAAPPTVRPRVVSARRSEQAAHESLRQSAAVGEMYLNNLLTAGLLDVPNVRVGELQFDVNPDRKWGRSSARMFIYLFVIGAMAIAGVGTWYWYSEKQRNLDVDRHLEVAKAASSSGSYVGLDQSLEEIRLALKRDPSSLLAIARYAEVAGLNSALYGELPPEEVGRAISAIESEVQSPSDTGYRELLVARTAIVLSTLDTMEGDESVTRLAQTLSTLRAWLEASPEDSLVRWLEGKALRAQGNRTGAEGAFAQAWSTGEGEVLAGIDIGDTLLDEGRADDALKVYNEVLEKAADHPLAIVGRALLRAEESREAGELMKDISIGLANIRGTRAKAYKALAEATAWRFLEDYDKFDASLAQATNVSEPRFLARVAMAQLQAGNFKKAGEIRDRIRWHSDSPQVNPLVKYVNAELLWHAGDARNALSEVEGLTGLRANSLRGRARFDLGEFAESRTELDAALGRAPDDRMLQVWSQAAKLVGAKSRSQRTKAGDELSRLALQSATKAARYPAGEAYLRLGRRKAARTNLESSIEELSQDSPNPLEYRSRVALATLELLEGKVGEANTQLTAALELNPGYLAAHDLMGQLLAPSDKKAALEKHLKMVIEAEMASARGELAYAVALSPYENNIDRKAALDAFRRAQTKGIDSDALREAIAKADEGLFEELGVKPKK